MGSKFAYSHWQGSYRSLYRTTAQAINRIALLLCQWIRLELACGGEVDNSTVPWRCACRTAWQRHGLFTGYSLVYVGHCAMGVSHIEASNDKLHPNRTHYTEWAERYLCTDAPTNSTRCFVRYFVTFSHQLRQWFIRRPCCTTSARLSRAVPPIFFRNNNNNNNTQTISNAP